LIEEAVQDLFPDPNDPFKFPDTWSVCFNECFEHYIIMPDEVGEVMIVYVPLPPLGESKADRHKPPRQGGGRERLRRILNHQVAAQRTVANIMYDAAADCGYGCHSETSDRSLPSQFNRRQPCNP
jgi:hypothetical protein